MIHFSNEVMAETGQASPRTHCLNIFVADQCVSKDSPWHRAPSARASECLSFASEGWRDTASHVLLPGAFLGLETASGSVIT